NPGFTVPEYRRNEVIAWFERGLRDVRVCRGRTLKSGIPWPGRPDHTVYVWFDALINYVTGVGFGTDEKKFKRWWPADVHVIGKDISRFHCIYWPAMLLSAGIELPRKIFVHGFLEYRGQRLTKSSGNMIDPFASAEEWGVDAARYLVLRDAPFEKPSRRSSRSWTRQTSITSARSRGSSRSRPRSVRRWRPPSTRGSRRSLSSRTCSIRTRRRSPTASPRSLASRRQAQARGLRLRAGACSGRTRP